MNEKAAREWESIVVYAGELSTQDNLKHLHPELVAQIVGQTWRKAQELGAKAERERIWAEIQSKLEMCADSWRIGELDLERIIFGEQV